MKKTISLIILLFLIKLSSIAQANLQYNRVVLVTLSGYFSGNAIDTTFTVPAGKVWKVESGMAGGIDFQYQPYAYNLYIDGKLICSSNSSWGGNFPIWLPMGTYTLSGICLQTTGMYLKGAISAIEYNEVP